MTAAPNLPPLPAQRMLRRVMPGDYRYGDVYGYTDGQIKAYALAAYQAGREAGWREAKEVAAYAGLMPRSDVQFSYVRGREDASGDIRSLISEAKEKE